jgi:hypothetical protein
MIIFTITSLFIAFIVYSLYKNSRKKAAPFPEKWHTILLDNVHFYKELSETKKKAFQKKMMQFLSEVYIDGVNLTIKDLDKVLIAASAVIPVFGFKEWHYPNLKNILLYPDHFNEDLEFDKGSKSKNIGGLVGNGKFEKQMILSQKALYHGFQNKTDKNNTGIHEFIHLIDKLDGAADGIPNVLMKHQYTIPWLKLIHEEMEEIDQNKSDIRNYGGYSEAEFLAVVSEYFFERPDLLNRKHPELYKMLEDCFNQDPKKYKDKKAQKKQSN